MDAGTVEDAIRGWWGAMARGDIDDLRTRVDEAVVIQGGPQGREFGRERFLAGARAFLDQGGVDDWRIESVRVAHHGHTAIATYTWSERGRMSGSAFRLDGVATDVYRCSDSGWRLVARHVGLSPGTPAPGAEAEHGPVQEFGGVLAGLPVADFDEAVAWYARILGEPPDDEPVPGVAEWSLAPGGVVQVVERAHAAGGGVVRLVVDDLDAAVAALRVRGLQPKDVGDVPGVVRYAEYADPSGNEVSLVEDVREKPLLQ